MQIIQCAHCDAPLRCPASMAGRRVRCGTCSTLFKVPDEDERFEDQGPVRSRRAVAERPRRRRSPAATDYRPLIKAGVGLAAVAGLVVAGVLLGPPAYRRLTAVPEPVVPEGSWQKVEVQGRFRCLMPGPATQEQAPGPLPMLMHQCSPNKDLVCMVGYSRDQLPPERLAAGPDQILSDGCEGAMRNLRQLGGTETSRTTVTLNGRYPGRELVVSVPRGQGKMIFRVYLVNNVVFMLCVGGRGIEPGGRVPEAVFNSFQII